ncbi:tripartite tricarboxylate transporter substrate binding protein [Roseomonas sp. HF4]|uniref:Bug family tripartite tricarboxylate transporter substrate binding protein n=1 Tax=Roseomonas sp. HF4 TaxID=2562313 RepID=UPI0010C0278F|nr:tripartite tricarboxylate transporter substrate-binding protein [Roseomonas sp. HF4]
MISRRTLALAGAGLLAAPAVRAAGWPERPVRVIIGYPAGGPTDLVGRLLQEPLQRLWGQAVVIENRPGASQIIASEAVARAAPDGYTLLLAASTHTSNVAVQQRLPYDTVADFTPISVLYGSPTVLFVSRQAPWRTVQDLVAAAKREPGVAFASSGNGSSGHFALEMFRRKAGIEVTHVAFRGAAPALQEVVSGRVPATFSTLSGAIGLQRQGQIRAIAVGGPQRAEVLDGVPTLAEVGLEIPDTSPWYGFIGPKGLPAEVVQRVERDTVALMREPAMAERIRDTGGLIIAEGQAEFLRRITREIEENREMARIAGVTAG